MPEHTAARLAAFEDLLQHLQHTRGFDFTAYKRTTLIRRVIKRMQEVGIEDFPVYSSYVASHPDEIEHLLNMILINVTSFFRDPAVWQRLRETIVPDIIANGPHSIRIWAAGCATGEEAYSLAMLFAEAAGVDEFRERVKIYATDVDEPALAQARAASYMEKELGGVPADLRERYFEEAGGAYVFNKDLRRSLIFGRHDLLRDAPISRVSLLTCRNAIMYLNRDAQEQVVRRFEFALRPGGYLLMGKAEMLLGRGPVLAPLDLKLRIFQKSVDPGRGRIPMTPTPDSGMSGDTRLRALALDADRTALMLLDRAGTVVVANDRTRILFGLSPDDVGRPFKDLEISYRPVELRSLVDQAVRERRSGVVRDVDWHAPNGERVALDVQVFPLVTGMLEVQGVKVLFNEVTHMRKLQDELKRTHQELETAYEELQSTNEELETTNEELQSTVEELETTNEELQSTNEELETMNEELQATNEELHTVNTELRDRSTDLNRANSFLESILRTLDEAVIVVDKELRVEAWNAKAHDMWGLRSEEVQGRHLLNLDIGFPMDQLLQAVKGCLGAAEGSTMTVDAMNRRGRSIQVKVTCSPIALDSQGRMGAIILMVEARAEVRS